MVGPAADPAGKPSRQRASSPSLRYGQRRVRHTGGLAVAGGHPIVGGSAVENGVKSGHDHHDGETTTRPRAALEEATKTGGSDSQCGDGTQTEGDHSQRTPRGVLHRDRDGERRIDEPTREQSRHEAKQQAGGDPGATQQARGERGDAWNRDVQRRDESGEAGREPQQQRPGQKLGDPRRSGEGVTHLPQTAKP